MCDRTGSYFVPDRLDMMDDDKIPSLVLITEELKIKSM